MQSVERAVFVLGALGDAGPEGLTLSELSRALGASKSSAFGILQTLLGYGFVADSGAGMSRRYRLGLALARLGDLVVSQIALRDVALPVLRDLTAATGLTSRVAVLEAPYAVVIGRVDAGSDAVRFATNLFKRELMHCSAVGKAMLAAIPEPEARGYLEQAGMPQKTRHTVTHIEQLMSDLAEARPKGYFLDDEEDAEGVCCIGSPIVVDGGVCAGAISVTGLKVDVPGWRLHQIGEGVRDHAAQVSRVLESRRCRREAGARRGGARPPDARCSAIRSSPARGRSSSARPSAACVAPTSSCSTDSSIRPSSATRSRSVTSGRVSSRPSATGVPGIAPGDRVVAECIIPCGMCGPCRAGATNVCTTYAELGFTHEGGASDEVVVPARARARPRARGPAARRRARRADLRRHARAREGHARAG